MLLDMIQEAKDALLAASYFSDIAVQADDLGDPGNMVEIALAKVGVGVVLATPKANVLFPDKPGPYFDDVQFIAGIFENVPVNRNRSQGGTGKKCLDIAENVAAVLHWHKPGGVSEILKCRQPTIVRVPSKILVYNVLFGTQGGISSPLPVLPTPVLGVAAAAGTSTVTITIGNPLAIAVYTTNNAYPSPAGALAGHGAYYTGPFQVATGTTLMVRTWLPGYIGSQLVKQMV